MIRKAQTPFSSGMADPAGKSDLTFLTDLLCPRGWAVELDINAQNFILLISRKNIYTLLFLNKNGNTFSFF
jgi:hypothetical protein